MNPYDVLTNPLRPTFQPDLRALQGDPRDSGIDRAVIQAAYRLVKSVDRLLFKRRR